MFLTSFKCVFKWECIVDLETLLGSASEASLVLVKSNIKDFIFVCRYHDYLFIISLAISKIRGFGVLENNKKNSRKIKNIVQSIRVKAAVYERIKSARV